MGRGKKDAEAVSTKARSMNFQRPQEKNLGPTTSGRRVTRACLPAKGEALLEPLGPHIPNALFVNHLVPTLIQGGQCECLPEAKG